MQLRAIPLEPQTLPELLNLRGSESSAEIGILDAKGAVLKAYNYRKLFEEAQTCAERLISAGLEPNGKDIILTSFENHENHIILFWAGCLAGIPVSPIPPFHPDQSRQVLFFEHLQALLHGPTVIAADETVNLVRRLVPDLKTITLSQLANIKVSPNAKLMVYPAISPKPDDVVCFMLTSGSTGNSKAVPLTHHNILSAVRGKVIHHGSTPGSRFLNWIAFDHVACVTEIHLHALHCNASQFHVAPSNIIRRPRNLLEWASKHRITYTFSPNFLMAQICRDVAAEPYSEGSLDLSHLAAFISGGESVPVKTGVEFSDLLQQFGARRNVLRPGFGMTETCAGSIYDTKEVLTHVDHYQEKYLSLGKCCPGINVRIVDARTKEVLGPSQEGQMQVSGPTVFKYYYNNPSATAESFQDGWFITGDAAKLDSDGNLHLVGRDKDNININGVKHPSVDVEHFIEDSHIEGVTKSFVFVCPMRLPEADTETYAVFYKHDTVSGEEELPAEELPLTLHANQAIKKSCTIFASLSPHIVLPLPNKYFVKTALGKVSRSALAKTYLNGQFDTLVEHLSALDASARAAGGGPKNPFEKTVFEIIGIVVERDASTLRLTDSLFDMGASSMHLMQLKQRVQDTLSLPIIPIIEFLRRPEIGELCDYLADLSSSQRSGQVVAYDPIVCLNPSGSKPPIFLVHPGVGEILVFINLARVLNDDRPIYAIRARGFEDGQESFSTFEEMVDTYATAIEARYPSGPYFVGGYSFGGAVAFEIGKKLHAKGKQVPWIGVFNLPPHIAFRMIELVWNEVLLNLCIFLSLITDDGFEEFRGRVLVEFPGLASSDVEPDNSDEVIDWVLDHSNQTRLHELQLSHMEFKRWVRVAYNISASGRTYEPSGVVPGALTTIFCAIPLSTMGTREEFKRNRLSKWKHFSDKLEMIDVDGEHYTMISEQHVESFAGKLRGALERATARSSL